MAANHLAWPNCYKKDEAHHGQYDLICPTSGAIGPAPDGKSLFVFNSRISNDENDPTRT